MNIKKILTTGLCLTFGVSASEVLTANQEFDINQLGQTDVESSTEGDTNFAIDTQQTVHAGENDTPDSMNDSASKDYATASPVDNQFDQTQQSFYAGENDTPDSMNDSASKNYTPATTVDNQIADGYSVGGTNENLDATEHPNDPLKPEGLFSQKNATADNQIADGYRENYTNDATQSLPAPFTAKNDSQTNYELIAPNSHNQTDGMIGTENKLTHREINSSAHDTQATTSQIAGQNEQPTADNEQKVNSLFSYSKEKMQRILCRLIQPAQIKEINNKFNVWENNKTRDMLRCDELEDYVVQQVSNHTLNNQEEIEIEQVLDYVATIIIADEHNLELFIERYKALQLANPSNANPDLNKLYDKKELNYLGNKLNKSASELQNNIAFFLRANRGLRNISSFYSNIFVLYMKDKIVEMRPKLAAKFDTPNN